MADEVKKGIDYGELNAQLQRLMDLAFMVAKDKKTKVVLGRGWYYDEKKNLISVAPLISVDDYEMAKAVLVHEIGHKKFTNFEAWMKMLDVGGKYHGNKLFHSCLNAVEDVYVENKMSKLYGGFDSFMAMANDFVGAKYAEDPGKVHAFAQRTMAIYDMARGYSCPFTVPEQYRAFAAEAAAIKKSGMETTVALAERIYEAIKEEFKEDLKKAKAGKDGWMPESEVERDEDREKDDEPQEGEPSEGEEKEDAEPKEGEGGKSDSKEEEKEESAEGKEDEGEDGEGAEEGEGEDGEGEGEGKEENDSDKDDDEEGDGKPVEDDGEAEKDESGEGEGSGSGDGEEEEEGEEDLDGDSKENEEEGEEGENEKDEEIADGKESDSEEGEPKEETGHDSEEEIDDAFEDAVSDFEGGIDPTKDAAKELEDRVDHDLLGKLQLVRPPLWYDAEDIENNIEDFNREFQKLNYRTRTDWDWHKGLAEDTHKLYTKLQNILLEACQTERLRGMPQGRIHGGSLHKIRHGDYKVFSKKVRGMDASQIAVAIVVDCSGSMDGTKAMAARDTAFIMGETLHKCGVKFGVYGFTSTRVVGNDYPINIEFKDFIAPWAGKKELLRHLGAYNNNYDAASILEVYKRLLAVNVKRRILIVISDGQPAPENPTYLKNLVPVLMQGVDVVGVGLSYTEIEKFYPHNVKCEVNNLAETLAPVLQNLMLDKHIKRGGRDIGLFADPPADDARKTAISE